MDAAVDSSMLISLTWSGSLWLVDACPFRLHIPAPVYEEVVTAGIARGYADAASIEAAIKDLPTVDARSAPTNDAAVLEAGQRIGTLLCNDIALGRRATNLNVLWLRTADVVLLSVKSGAISAERGRGALRALHGSGRITHELLTAYLEEFP